MGAHLAGVPVLHRWLASSPQTVAGPYREYHVLDSAGLLTEGSTRDSVLDSAQASLDQVRAQGRSDGCALLRAAMLADPDVYFDHFAGLLSRPGAALAMDLTPEHALLDADQLRAVQDGFASRGVRTAAAFVMRDPLHRIVTHARLEREQQPGRFAGPLEEWVERWYAEPAYELRTRYDLTLDALDRSFGPGDVWFGFRERLAGADSLSGLAGVAKIAHSPDQGPAPRRHPSVTAGLPTDLAREIVGHYRHVYDHVADRFGLDDLERTWPSAQLIA